jgi:hypothetical protein
MVVHQGFEPRGDDWPRVRIDLNGVHEHLVVYPQIASTAVDGFIGTIVLASLHPVNSPTCRASSSPVVRWVWWRCDALPLLSLGLWSGV